MTEAQSSRPTTVLIVMAHPDDGEFMCGATVARWAREGRDIWYCVATNGDVGTSDPEMTSESLATTRRAEAQEAARRLGVQHDVIFLGYGDSRLVPSLELRRDVTRVIRRTQPDVVITQDPTTYWHGQGYINHPDHRCIGEVTLAAIMPSADTRLVFPELLDEGALPHKIKELFLTNTTHDDRWIEVTRTDIERQADALRAHVSQIGAERDPMEWMERGARESAAEARRHGHDFELAEGYKYFRFG
jgi:LmbE family N-acetylglucosaminyl deacetylase